MKPLDPQTRAALASAVPLDGSLAGTLRRLRAAIEEDAKDAPDEVLYSATARTGPLLERAKRGLSPRPVNTEH